MMELIALFSCSEYLSTRYPIPPTLTTPPRTLPRSNADTDDMAPAPIIAAAKRETAALFIFI